MKNDHWSTEMAGCATLLLDRCLIPYQRSDSSLTSEEIGCQWNRNHTINSVRSRTPTALEVSDRVTNRQKACTKVGCNNTVESGT